MTRTAADLLNDHAAPALQLVASSHADRFSRIGGRPNLPEGESWPRWQGTPLAFIAQLDLAEIPDGAPRFGLPASGCLWFFYDAEQSTWGFDPKDHGSWKVIHATQRPASAPIEPPDDLPEHGEYEANPIEFRPFRAPPSLERLELIAGSLQDLDEDDIDEARRACYQDHPHHQIGGYPDAVQNDSMEVECQLVSNGLYCGNESGYADERAAELAGDAAAWKLLLQIDSDDDAGMMWGDCGLIYFWIRDDDLARQDFSRVWMVLQCG